MTTQHDWDEIEDVSI